jgi:hypothetical protein
MVLIVTQSPPGLVAPNQRDTAIVVDQPRARKVALKCQPKDRGDCPQCDDGRDSASGKQDLLL